MDFLFIDHYFSQDIREMSAAAGNHAICSVPFTYSGTRARRRKFYEEYVVYPIWRVARRMLGRGGADRPPAAKFRENLQARARFLQWRARDCENVIARKQRVS